MEATVMVISHESKAANDVAVVGFKDCEDLLSLLEVRHSLLAILFYDGKHYISLRP